MSWQYWRWWLAEKMGWTLDYVDQLDLADLMEGLIVLNTRDKAISDAQAFQARARGLRGRRR
jgi:hypothetical protein